MAKFQLSRVKIKFVAVYSVLVLGLGACIGDDLIDDLREPEIRITNPIQSLAVGDVFDLNYMFLNNVGQQMVVAATWKSNSPNLISIDANGLITGLSPGNASISIEILQGGVTYRDAISITIGQTTSTTNGTLSGSLRSTSGYLLKGDYELVKTDSGLKLKLLDNFEATTALPGLYVYLSNNQNSIGDALEIGSIKIFKGAHEFNITGVGLKDYSFILYYCKPFNVKVGDATL